LPLLIESHEHTLEKMIRKQTLHVSWGKRVAAGRDECVFWNKQRKPLTWEEFGRRVSAKDLRTTRNKMTCFIRGPRRPPSRSFRETTGTHSSVDQKKIDAAASS